MTRSTFALPAIIAASSLLGLLSALLGDGWRDMLSWAALSAPLLAVAWAWRRARRR